MPILLKVPGMDTAPMNLPLLNAFKNCVSFMARFKAITIIDECPLGIVVGFLNAAWVYYFKTGLQQGYGQFQRVV